MTMNKLNYILVFVFCLITPFSIWAGLTEEELEPYKSILPKGLTPKDISEWKLDATYKKDTLNFKANTYVIKLNKKDKRKLEKKKKVRLKIAGGVVLLKPGKKPKPYYKGNANIYVLSTGETPKVVGKKRLKLIKFCSS